MKNRLERQFRVREIAEAWEISADSVHRLFGLSKKASRIPESLLNRVRERVLARELRYRL